MPKCATLSHSVGADTTVRVLLLTGAGRGFCAGQDLGDRAVAPGDAPVDLGASIERNYKPLVLGLRALPMPVVCAVNGVAAGAGANLALACDHRHRRQVGELHPGVLQAGSRFLTPAARTSCRASSAHARALGLSLLGDKLTAEQAAAMGAHLAMRRGRRVAGRHGQAPGPSRAGAHARSRRHQGGAASVRRQHLAGATRCRARLAARARQQRRLSRRGGRIRRQAAAEFTGR